MAFFFTKLIRNLIFLALFLNAIQYYVRWKSYTISAKDFKQLSAKAADKNGLDAVSSFTSELRRRYSQQVPSDLFWVPMSAGGLHLKAQFLYGDVTEYVALFAAPIDTSGRSGLHWVNSTCTTLTGEVSRVSDAFNTPVPVKESFPMGQNFRHGQFESFVYQLKEGTVVACYGRGFVPASSVWSLSGTIANGDPFSGIKLMYAYGRLTFDGLVRNVKSTADHVTDYVKKKTGKTEL